LLTHQAGKTILVCGHPDHLLPIIKRARAKPLLDAIGNTQYGYLFKLGFTPGHTRSYYCLLSLIGCRQSRAE
jgi:hypothetical protein